MEGNILVFYRDILAIGIGWVLFGLLMIIGGIMDLRDALKEARQDAVNA